MSDLTPASPILVALDYHRIPDAINMAKQLDPEKCRVKVGKELFTAVGPAILSELHKLGFQVFLDLKFHDIPNTVAGAVAAAADHGVWMVNVHASGGRRMMEAAADRLSRYASRPLLIAVTVLTSMSSDDLLELGITKSPEDQVTHLASLASSSGMDGVVCSAKEIAAIRQVTPSNFVLVTPGIRPANADKGDQRRVMTPKEALEAGSDYLVIGRPITQAEDPLKALEAIYQEIS